MKDQPLHPLHDEALAWVLGEGTAENRAAFEQKLANDAELQRLTDLLLEDVSLLAHGAPQTAPPPQILDQLITRIQTEPPSEPEQPVLVPARRKFPIRETLAWAAAMVLGVGLLNQWNSNRQQGDRITDLEGELEKRVNLEETNEERLRETILKYEEGMASLERQLNESQKLARLEIDSLNATIDEYQQGVAVVIWDQDMQTGILKLEKMPPLNPEQDYQLWVVDSTYENPVDGGIVSVDEEGFATVEFKPDLEVNMAEKFAISVERKGGVPVAEGPIVLLSP